MTPIYSMRTVREVPGVSTYVRGYDVVADDARIEVEFYDSRMTPEKGGAQPLSLDPAMPTLDLCEMGSIKEAMYAKGFVAHFEAIGRYQFDFRERWTEQESPNIAEAGR